MPPARILIIDPGLRVGEGHHLGVDTTLGAAAVALGHEPIVLAHARSPLKSLTQGDATIPVLPAFPHSIYLGNEDRTYEDLELVNKKARQQLIDLGDSLFREPVRVLIHTTNETQVLGVAQWLCENMESSPRRITSAVVALMFPPPIERTTDGIKEKNPAVCKIYSRAIRLLASVPGVSVLGIGYTVAEDHTISSGVNVEVGGALVAGIGRPIKREPPSNQPTVLLYMGDAKIDKGFHILPEIVRQLRRSEVNANFVIHASGSMVERYSWIMDALVLAIGDDARFDLKRGRLSEEEFHGLWDSADLALLAYHPGVYARKTSGICWDAINTGIPVIAVENTWHMLELERYGHPVVASPAFLPEPLVEALLCGIGMLPSLYHDAQKSRDRFLKENDPKMYIERLFQ